MGSSCSQQPSSQSLSTRTHDTNYSVIISSTHVSQAPSEHKRPSSMSNSGPLWSHLTNQARLCIVEQLVGADAPGSNTDDETSRSSRASSKSSRSSAENRKKSKYVKYVQEIGGYFEGEFEGDEPRGYGRIFYEDGRYYQGYFRNGKGHCDDGLLVYPDGSCYRGHIRNSAASGKGKFHNSETGFRYEGEWRNNKPEGYGEETFGDGTIYKGYFQKGVKHGRGTLITKTSRVEGQFENGQVRGQAKYEFRGNTLTGQFRGNMANGRGQLVTKQGTYTGEFVNNKRQGVGRFEYHSGTVYVGEWKNDKPHGPGRLVFKNGSTLEGSWKDGENVQIKVAKEGKPYPRQINTCVKIHEHALSKDDTEPQPED